MFTFSRTSQEFFDDMSKIHPDFIITGDYLYSNSRMHIKHIKCNYEWDTDAITLYRCGCPKCGNAIKKTQEEFESQVYVRYPYLKITSSYNGVSKKVSVLDTRCNHKWDSLPWNILSGHGCPYCSGRKVLKGFNDISSVASYMLPLFVNIEDVYTHTPNSHAKVDMRCPDCGHIMSKQIKSVFMQGFSCDYCADSISYPNKFLRAFLKQLPIEKVRYEYTPKWAECKKFDSYFSYNGNKYIIEMDGDFHFKSRFKNCPIKGTKERDSRKDQMALEHGIKMIRIEARISELEYIKSKIMESELSTIFDLSNIDWISCGAFAESNYVKDFCNYYNQNKWDVSICDICKHFGISKITFNKLLRRGISIGWINESSEERCLIRSMNHKNKRFYCFELYDSEMNKLHDFNSALSCSKYISFKYHKVVSSTLIADIINEHRKDNTYKGFIFKKKNNI